MMLCIRTVRKRGSSGDLPLTRRGSRWSPIPFTVWHFTPNTITGDVRKVYGVFNASGKFDINAEWPFVKEGYSAVEKDWSTRIHSINGITKMSNAAAETSTTKTIITK